MIPSSGTIITTNIYVRFTPVEVQQYNGDITNWSSEAETKTIGVSGTGTNSCDPNWETVPYTNSTIAYGIVTINGLAASDGDKVGAFIGSECRGISTVVMNQRTAYVTLNIQGEQIEVVGFKVYHLSDCKIYEVGYSTSTNPGNSIGYPPNYLPIASSSNAIQTINMTSGWNYISFYVHSQDMTPASIFGPIVNDLIQVKNLSQSYDPTVPDYLNSLSSLEDGYGYLVKLNNDATLSIQGSIIGSVSVPLTTGWNLIGHPKQNALPVTTVFATILDDIYQIKSVDNSFDPSVPDFLNTLSMIEPGQGYFIKMKNSSAINYSVVSKCNHENKSAYYLNKIGRGVVTYCNSTTVYGEIVYDGKEKIKYIEAIVQGECRAEGKIVNSEGKNYVTLVVNGEKEEAVEFNLFGEDFNLIGKSTTTFLAVPGKIIYHRIFFDEKDNNDTRSWEKLTKNKLYPVFPNPFNPTTNISFDLIETTPVRIVIYDINGAQVKQILFQVLSKGHYSYEWNGKNELEQRCSSGVYFLRITTEHYSSSQKLFLIK